MNKFEIFVTEEHFREAYGYKGVLYPEDDKGITADMLEKYSRGFLRKSLSRGFPAGWRAFYIWHSDGNRYCVTLPSKDMQEKLNIFCVVTPRESELIATCGFSISMDNEDMFKEYERENGITLEREKVTADAMLLDSRMLRWLDYRYGSARDEGHDGNNDRIGTLFIYRNLEEIEDSVDRQEPLRQSSGSWYEPDGLWDGLNYPDMWCDITIEFFEVVRETEEK